MRITTERPQKPSPAKKTTYPNGNEQPEEPDTDLRNPKKRNKKLRTNKKNTSKKTMADKKNYGAAAADRKALPQTPKRSTARFFSQFPHTAIRKRKKTTAFNTKK